jgi:hypothetical protein
VFSVSWPLLVTLLLGASLARQARAQIWPGTPQAASLAPLSAEQRGLWFAHQSFGVESWAAALFSTSLRQVRNSPEEWGQGWDGFGRRLGTRMASNAIGNLSEAALGSLWGEDPRYPKIGVGPVGMRLKHVLKMAVLAQNQDGQYMPAYARYAGTLIAGQATNLWRPPSENSQADALRRVATRAAFRVFTNFVDEFGGDMKRKLTRRKPRP